jgi:hypothetical protein
MVTRKRLVLIDRDSWTEFRLTSMHYTLYIYYLSIRKHEKGKKT